MTMPLPYDQEFFQTLPETKEDRKVYVQRLRENYQNWKASLVAGKFRPNILLAFEKLIHHTTEWLGMRSIDNTFVESNLKLFFELLKERWNEFMEKTNENSAKRKNQNEDDSENRDNTRSKKMKSSESSDGPLDSTDAVMSDASFGPPVLVLLESFDDDDDESNYSQVSYPFPKPERENFLWTDATMGLFKAIIKNDLALVQDCCAKGGRLDFVDDFGNTPLHCASVAGNQEVIQCLRLWGADPWKKNLAGQLPLHIAACHGHLDLCQLLVKLVGGAPSIPVLLDNRGRNPLHLACKRGRINTVQFFVETCGKGIIHLCDSDKLSPRHYARLGRHEMVVAFLDSLGADRSDDGLFDPSNFHHACGTGRLGLAKWLYEWSDGVDLTKRDHDGRTPQECAINGGHTDVVEWIDTLDPLLKST